MPTLDELFERLWNDYASLNPQVREIHRLLDERGERVVNDHIAFRTYDDPRVSLEAMAGPFLTFGYETKEEYHFPEKHLTAWHYEHPEPERPKIFISELKLEAFTEEFRVIVKRLIDQVPGEVVERWDFPTVGRPWRVSYEDYTKLAAESEYGAWVAALGFRANHFTVDVNQLQGFESLQQFNAFLKEEGFQLNSSGGEIKGFPEVYLEQSSTVAGEVAVEFEDGVHHVPGCYYEFAKRYPLPNGQMFQGFVASSATRIFESTDRGSRES